MNGNGSTIIAVVAALLLIIGGVVLPLRAAIDSTNARIERERESVNERIKREISVIERDLVW